MSKKENIIKKVYLSALKSESEMVRNFIIINTKCLLSDKKQRYVKIDNNRLRDELKYYRYYGKIDKESNIINTSLPLILSNNNIEKSEPEIYELIKKYVTYIKIEKPEYEYTIASVIYNEVVHNIIENTGISYEDIIRIIKDKLISFNPPVDKSMIVGLQMYRIKLISIVDKYADGIRCEEDDLFVDVLNALFDIYIEDREENKNVDSIKELIMSILSEDDEMISEKNGFYESMAEYMVKVGKYIAGQKEYNYNANPLDIIRFEEGGEYRDPILNKIKIISKKMNGNILNINVDSKSGEYCFRFIKK